MPLARIGDRILFFAHIPKTGGSSVETYLDQKGAVALRFKRRMGWSETTAQHMEARIHTRLVPDGFFDASFAVLRDPVARMVSEYRYRRDRYERQRDFPAWVRAAFDAYGRDQYVFDNHIRPQTEYLRPGMVLFRLEAGMDAVCDWIDAETGTPPASRDIWEKKSATEKVAVPDDLRDEIIKFYEADYAVMDRMIENGRALDPAA
ncbi:sulfotransferase family 2 domain-containing protein [Gymnodinialimonas hymeniacidonis]|uniref:sulfotransferase family 2 domain-containing protein n=1 Tax=Gymnodinialimonas hymeniacidonis TaxID=3126508 RepID=UPI0034C6B520